LYNFQQKKKFCTILLSQHQFQETSLKTMEKVNLQLLNVYFRITYINGMLFLGFLFELYGTYLDLQVNPACWLFTSSFASTIELSL
jgi:hypothetical protein